jgi:HSP20 family molecular chaperone IbpA
MKVTAVKWQNICEEVRFWDVSDFLRNFDDEMENVAKGCTNLRFCKPEDLAAPERLALEPNVALKGDQLVLCFPGLDGVSKDDIDVSIEGGVIFVGVEVKKHEGGSTHGWFRMKLPSNLDADTCEAEHTRGTLCICISQKKETAKRKKIKLK